MMDKQESSGLHVALDKASGGKPYLGDPEVVQILVRKFIRGVLDSFDDVQAGKYPALTASNKNRDSCLEYGLIFSGNNPDYETMGEAWNGPGLRDSILRAFPIKDLDKYDDTGVIQQGFGMFNLMIYRMLTEFAKTRDGETLQKKIELLVEAVTGLLLGMPNAESDLEEVRKYL